MNSKIIILIVVIAVLAAGYLMISQQYESDEHAIIILSKSSYMEVPDTSNASNKVDKNGIFYYNDNESDINITSSSNLSSASSEKVMEKLKDSCMVGSKKIKEDNVIIYEKNNIYSIFIENTQYKDVILIQSLNKELLIKCWESVKFHNPTDNFKVDNVTQAGKTKVVNAVEKTQKAAETSKSPSSGFNGYDWSYGSSSSGSESSSKSYSTSDNVGGAASSAKFDFN